MWNYTEKVIEHFIHPRNVGEIENPDGVGEVGSLACGDMLRLSFKLDDEGRIVDARFKTFGCASAIASSSALTEIIRGKTLEEAERITNRDIAEYLGGLPEEKMHCSVMGREALEAAIANYRGEGAETRTLEGTVVCKCYGVTDEQIRKVARENRLTTVEEVTNYTKAGGGCGLCHERIQEILDEIRNGKTAPTTPAQVAQEKKAKGLALTNIEKIHIIEQLISERIRPALRQDGGDIDLLDVDQNVVYVRLKGACENCPSANYTMRQFIEKEIQREVSPSIRVEEVRA
ncbi:MAG: Fe-S cluster assembly protein NifU [Proteobacteria bacterium]|nr:Fe-S cluster assembly protein NifU [Pseudomonadota bacterium]